MKANLMALCGVLLVGCGSPDGEVSFPATTRLRTADDLALRMAWTHVHAACPGLVAHADELSVETVGEDRRQGIPILTVAIKAAKSDDLADLGVRENDSCEFVFSADAMKFDLRKTSCVRLCLNDARYVEDKMSANLADAMAASRKALIERQFSSWDGSHSNLVKEVKSTMHDPGSFEHVDTTYVDRRDDLLLRMKFRGANAFGGKVLNEVVASADLDGKVLSVETVGP